MTSDGDSLNDRIGSCADHRDLTEVQALLSRLRQHYMEAKQAQGYQYHLPPMDGLPVGSWKRYPVTTRAQRQHKLKKWSKDHLIPGELNPDLEARVKVYSKVPDEMAYLERIGAYGPQRRLRKGRPSADIPAALLELRAGSTANNPSGSTSPHWHGCCFGRS